MALTVTPGGASDDSYVEVADADAYVLATGFVGWPSDQTEKEQALRRATNWLDGKYLHRFPGQPVNGRSQSLQWPRSSAVDIDGNAIDEASIPAEIERATIEAALREAVTPNCLTPDYVKTQQVKRRKVGPIEREFFETSSADDIQPFVTSVEHIVKPILTRRITTPIMAV